MIKVLLRSTDRSKPQNTILRAPPELSWIRRRSDGSARLQFSTWFIHLGPNAVQLRKRFAYESSGAWRTRSKRQRRRFCPACSGALCFSIETNPTQIGYRSRETPLCLAQSQTPFLRRHNSYAFENQGWHHPKVTPARRGSGPRQLASTLLREFYRVLLFNRFSSKSNQTNRRCQCNQHHGT